MSDINPSHDLTSDISKLAYAIEILNKNIDKLSDKLDNFVANYNETVIELKLLHEQLNSHIKTEDEDRSAMQKDIANINETIQGFKLINAKRLGTLSVIISAIISAIVNFALKAWHS